MSRPVAAPPLWRLAAEGRAAAELLRFAVRGDVGHLPRGDGHPVLVFPGFLAGDPLTAPLRRRLDRLGYAAAGWRLGANLGLKPGLLPQILEQVQSVHARSGRKVSLVGWSLGGLYAREVAKRAPGAVRLIVTLGTPCVGDMRANNAWKLYETLNDHWVNRPPIDTALCDLPPVPLTGIYSPTDGIVAPASAMIGAGPTWEMIAVRGSHIGLAWNPDVLAILADRLAQPEAAWRPYRDVR